MNRGKRKGFVTVALIVASIVAALIVELIGGSAIATSSPSTSSTARSQTTAPAVAAPPGSTVAVGAGSYRTVGTSVNLRGAPTTGSPVITVLRDLGSPVTLSCYERGTSVGGDPWWYRATYVSAHGYIAGFWVNTGPDPAKTHLPAC